MGESLHYAVNGHLPEIASLRVYGTPAQTPKIRAVEMQQMMIDAIGDEPSNFIAIPGPDQSKIMEAAAIVGREVMVATGDKETALYAARLVMTAVNIREIAEIPHLSQAPETLNGE